MDLGLKGKTALVTAFGAFVDLPDDAFVDAINGNI